MSPIENEQTFNGFEAPGTTPVPDYVFDFLMKDLTGNELKVLLYIIRRTFGFGKSADAISLSQFRDGMTTKEGKVLNVGCGVGHNRLLLIALNGLQKKGCVISEKQIGTDGSKETTIYKLRFKKAEQAVTPSNEVVTSGNQGGSYFTPQGVVTSGNQQETHVEQETLNTYDADASLPHVFSDDELLTLLRERGYSITNQPELSTPDTANVDNSPEQVATCNPIATDTPQPSTENENGSQSELIARPEKPEMPPTSMKLSAEKIVQITEALIGKYYNAKQRPKQIIAAKKILAEGVTEEQYIAAYTDMRPWWNENQGVFHVVDLAANTQRKQMRVLELIERIETRGHLRLVKPAAQEEKPRKAFSPSQIDHHSDPWAV